MLPNLCKYRIIEQTMPINVAVIHKTLALRKVEKSGN